MNTDHRSGQNVGHPGEDIIRGQEIPGAGKRIAPAELGLLASLGVAEVGVYRRVRAAFFSSGDELRSVGQPLDEGAILMMDHKSENESSDEPRPYRPNMTQAGLAPTHPVSAVDEQGIDREVQIAGESPLTLYVDDREIVTLMTLGSHPEALALGYLRTQRFIERIEDVRSVRASWDTESARVNTWRGVDGWDDKLKRRTVTTGCGQGTVFSCTLDSLYSIRLPEATITQSVLYGLLDNIRQHNDVYKRAGAVHGCGLCRGQDILMFVEDVGRHNAADAIAGYMWLEHIPGGDKIFYTTGRLTSEIVMKVAQIGIPVLVSRSGVTHMGLELARELGVTMIGRAKGRHFLVFNGTERMVFDAKTENTPPGRDGGVMHSRIPD